MDTDREAACAAIPAPASVSGPLVRYVWRRDIIGQPCGAIYRLHGKSRRACFFLMHGQRSAAGNTADEIRRLR